MLKFFHTSDWHFGLKAQYTATIEHTTQKIRQARIETLQKVKLLAKQHDIQFMLMAGDNFDHHHVDLSTIHQVIQILNDFPCDVYLISGNHDYHNPKEASIYFHSAFKSLKPHVHIITETKQIKNDEHRYVLWNAPLSSYSSTENPTEAFYPFKHQISPEGYFKIGMAHGSLTHAYYTEDADFPINPSCATEYQLDYLALGHWHSYLATSQNRLVYSGTPEPTQFNERDSGNIVLVEIAQPQAEPKLTKIETKTLNWLVIDEDLTEYPDDGIHKVRQQLDLLINPASTLCRITLKGFINPSVNHELTNLAHHLEHRNLIYYKFDTQHIHYRIDPQEIETMLSQSNVLKSVYTELLERQQKEEISPEDDAVIKSALEFINTSLSMHQTKK